MSQRDLVIIDVKPGAAMESQSGLNQKAPKIYGALAEPAGRKRAAAIVCHPTSNFLNHYLIDPLAERGVACMGLNTRYVGSDVTLLMERVIQDLGAAVKYLRARGYDKVVLIGNSGGASTAALYQSQAEKLTIDQTLDGQKVNLVPSDLPPVAGLTLCAAHPGRARTLAEWLDPALLDEKDPLSLDPALDMFSSANAPPFSKAFLDAFRSAQRARYERLEQWVCGRLRMLRSQPEGPLDEAFVVYRTHADPRFLDLGLDSNDRAVGSLWGVPEQVNSAANAMGRFTTLTAWLSQWSSQSRADGPNRIAETSVPVQLFDYTADQSVFPSSIAAWTSAIDARMQGGKTDLQIVKGGNHYLAGQSALLTQVADQMADWIKAI